MHPRPPSSRKQIHLLFAAAISMSLHAAAGQAPPRQVVQEIPKEIASQMENLNDRFWLYLPKRYKETPDPLPLILYLHGSSRRGSDPSLVKANGIPPLLDEREDFEFIVASPQALHNFPWQTSWRPDDLILLLDHLLENYRIDAGRVYLTGLSMGGYGTWACGAAYPERFAAVIPICGGGDPEWGEAFGDLPIWAFHGDEDRVVPPEQSIEMVKAVKAAGGRAKLTLYPGVGHDSYTMTYANPETFRWLLEHRLSARSKPESP